VIWCEQAETVREGGVGAMGYDLYITRVQDLSERDRFPISLREFCSAVAERPGWSIHAGVDPEYLAEAAGFVFDHPSPAEASFTALWSGGPVGVSKPTTADIPELAAVAEALGAMVVGEYCERYFADGSRVEFE
jgi:hypothetical protein